MENTQKVFKRIRKIRGKYLSIHGEYDELRAVCVLQNHLQVRRKYMNVVREYAESGYGEYARRIYLIRQRTKNGSHPGKFSTKPQTILDIRSSLHTGLNVLKTSHAILSL
jgi:hypothetical protein